MKLEDVSVEAVKELLEYIRATKDFTLEHAPEVARQMLVYDAWRAGLWMWPWGILTTMLFLFGCLWLWKTYVPNNGHWTGDYWAGVCICWLLAVCASLGIYANYMTMVKIEMAPKVYLVERLVRMTKPPCP